MDLDSVVRRTFHERNYKGSANPLDYKQKDEVLDSLGLYFYYDVLDVYQVNLGSLPSRWAGLFDRRKLTGDIVERIHNFISECEYIPALANLPTMISRVLETVAV